MKMNIIMFIAPMKKSYPVGQNESTSEWCGHYRMCLCDINGMFQSVYHKFAIWLFSWFYKCTKLKGLWYFHIIINLFSLSLWIFGIYLGVHNKVWPKSLIYNTLFFYNTFSKIFDVEWFISHLSRDVKVIKELPKNGGKIWTPYNMHVPRKCNERCYQICVLPVLFKKYVSYIISNSTLCIL